MAIIHGMTGFGAGQEGTYRVEMRSLNHRFLEISVKLPAMLAPHDVTMRNRITGTLSRGKIDVSVTASQGERTRVSIDKEKAFQAYNALRELRDSFDIKDEIGVNTLLSLKDLFLITETISEPDDLLKAFERALEGLSAMRQREGESLTAEIKRIAFVIDDLNKQIMDLCPPASATAREKAIAKIRAVLPEDMKVDETRLMHEVSQMVERADITEELTRITHHVEHARKILDDGGTIGKKLDFIFQELYREANTVASKADDMGIMARVIDMKAEIEKGREQVQNIQ